MKKYLIIVVMAFISISSIGVDLIEADTNKSSSEVGITFIDDNAQSGDETKNEGEVDNDNKENLPSTGSTWGNDLILLGLFSILLALFIRREARNKKR